MVEWSAPRPKWFAYCKRDFLRTLCPIYLIIDFSGVTIQTGYNSYTVSTLPLLKHSHTSKLSNYGERSEPIANPRVSGDIKRRARTCAINPATNLWASISSCVHHIS